MLLVMLISAAPTAAKPPPAAADLPDVPYSWELSTLAQRYFGQCRAEARLRDQLVRDFNERHLTEPPFRSFRNKLAPADRRDADLVCLGAALQELDDDFPATAKAPPEAGTRPGVASRPISHPAAVRPTHPD